MGEKEKAYEIYSQISKTKEVEKDINDFVVNFLAAATGVSSEILDDIES